MDPLFPEQRLVEHFSHFGTLKLFLKTVFGASPVYSVEHSLFSSWKAVLATVFMARAPALLQKRTRLGLKKFFLTPFKMTEKKPNLNVCIIGHVDSGKSTTVGNLAFQLGIFNKRQYDKLKAEADSQGKGTFAYAYFFDKTSAERQRGITIDITLKEFNLKKFKANIIDCPGHKDFIKNMVTGAAQADVAVAIVPASDFASAISPKATLKDHIMISWIMGIEKLIICVNKMDEFDNLPADQQKKKFEWIKNEMLFITKKLQHPDKDPIMLPISGFKGNNIVDSGVKYEWFEGWQKKDKDGNFVGEKIFTLEGALNSCEVPKRPLDKPLRMPITDIHTITGIGTIYTGRVDTGVIKPGMPITIQPADVIGEVKSLQIHKQDQKEVSCGENIGLALKSGAKGNLTQIKKGNVISEQGENACAIYPACKAMIAVVEHPKGIKEGYCPVMDLGSHHVPAKIGKIIEKRNLKSKEMIKDPEMIHNKETAMCIIVPQKPVVMEPFAKFPTLARFALRDGGKIVALGRIADLLALEECTKMGVAVPISKAAAAKAEPAKGKSKKTKG